MLRLICNEEFRKINLKLQNIKTRSYKYEKRAAEKEEDIKQKKEVIKEIQKEKGIFAKNKAQKGKENQELYKNRKKEYNELNLIVQEEKKYY